MMFPILRILSRLMVLIVSKELHSPSSECQQSSRLRSCASATTAGVSAPTGCSHSPF